MTRRLLIGQTGDGAFEPDLDQYRTTGLRVGIFGSSGSGKGYTLGRLLEDVIAHKVPCIMLDAEQELWTFKEVGALVVGGKHADAPFVEDPAALDAVIRFALTTATPVVFDVGVVAEARESEAARLGELIMARVYAVEDDLRVEMMFACTEASIFAPQTVPRGVARPEMMRQIFQRGRKRGMNIAIETQRLADIQKSCISQANLRFFGFINTADDWAAVSRNLPGRTFTEQQAMPQGVFYVAPGGFEIKVHPRLVTHGGGGPDVGEVLIREVERTGLDAVLALLNRAASSVSSPSSEAEKPEQVTRSAGERGVSRIEFRNLQTETATLRRRADGAEHNLALAREREQAAVAASVAAQADLAALSDRVEAMDAFSAALQRLVGPLNGQSASFDEGAVRRIVRAEMGDGGGRPAVALVPQGALRERYMEQAAGRLVERVRQLEPDEREVLLFLLAHPDNFQTITAITKGIVGHDGGSARERFGKAASVLADAGLVQVGGSGRAGRKAIVDQWVRSALGPHNPTDDDIARVRDRALEVVLIDD